MMTTVETTPANTLMIDPKTTETSPLHPIQRPSWWVKIQQFFKSIATYNETISQYESASSNGVTDPATAHMHWGIQLAEAGQLAQAIEKFEQAAILNPAQAEVFCNWGVALAKQKQLPEATIQLRKAVELEPDRAAYQVLLGATLVEQGLLAEGEQHYQQAIILKPNHTEPLLNWAIALARSNYFVQAIEKLTQVLQKQPTHSQAFYLWGAILAEQQDYPTAIEKLLHCLKFQANHAEATYLLSLCYNRSGEFKLGLEAATKAITLQSEKAECFLTKGDCLANLGHFQQAIEYYDLALALNPKLPDVYLSLGQVYCQQGNPSEADIYFEQAEKLNPLLPALQRVWGISLLERHLNEAAIEKFKTACHNTGGETACHDGFPETSLGLAVAQLRLGLLEQASNTTVSALIHFPDNVGLWHTKGCIASKQYQSNLTEALYCFETALTHQSDFIQAQLNLAICKLQEDSANALEVVRTLRVLYREKQQHSPLVVTYYGLALMAQGDITEAEVKFKQALTLDTGYTKAMAALLMIYVKQNIEPATLQQFMTQIEETETQQQPLPTCWLWAKALVNYHLWQTTNAEVCEQAGRVQWERLQQAEPWLKPTAFEECLTVQPWRLWLLMP
jgi:tetratricopeptide (TPR) repeat protein